MLDDPSELLPLAKLVKYFWFDAWNYLVEKGLHLGTESLPQSTKRLMYSATANARINILL